MNPMGKLWHVVTHPLHLRRTVLITFVVGTWLTLFNEGDVLWHAGITPAVLVKVLLNYATPFVVANLGLLSAAEPPITPPSTPRSATGLPKRTYRRRSTNANSGSPPAA